MDEGDTYTCLAHVCIESIQLSAPFLPFPKLSFGNAAHRASRGQRPSSGSANTTGRNQNYFLRTNAALQLCCMRNAAGAPDTYSAGSVITQNVLDASSRRTSCHHPSRQITIAGSKPPSQADPEQPQQEPWAQDAECTIIVDKR
eukprot:1161524-Pelagomonas_calceolata.AAC.3